MYQNKPQWWPKAENVIVTHKDGMISEHGHSVKTAPARFCVSSYEGWEVAWTDDLDIARSYAKRLIIEADQRQNIRDETGKWVAFRHDECLQQSWDRDVNSQGARAYPAGCSIHEYVIANHMHGLAKPGEYVALLRDHYRRATGPVFAIAENPSVPGSVL